MRVRLGCLVRYPVEKYVGLQMLAFTHSPIYHHRLQAPYPCRPTARVVWVLSLVGRVLVRIFRSVRLRTSHVGMAKAKVWGVGPSRGPYMP